ncbi:NAD(P)H-hydrate dehydratase [Aliiroseovarius subalbicans]|uniref:NAD(P)H-hydrate dehydratase n=1 Tax=Aliiroseovarius subalbicans TaxID=2925840 RepID=UPI001F584DBD|nr:NAD(P)H-hydrate dehydratase [Aliiroseovarius subalbicans]MCI2398658.1 NAD(P)H-hydrate dehydratase [Aliiroseovarius subalbicans]
MTELLTAAQMRAIEQAAIESGDVTGLELMERAGRGVVEAIFEEWPELAKTSHRAVVLCGPGNNGGDGFVVARLLKEWGWEVEVFLYGDAEKLPSDARVNYERWEVLGETQSLKASTWERAPFPGTCDLVIDALFGTGLAREVALPLSALSCMPEVGQTHRTLSVDLPSGYCSDSGTPLGDRPNVVEADLTVSFHTLKLGHVLAAGSKACGKSVVKSIGLKSRPAMSQGHWVKMVEKPQELGKGNQGHKFSHGHALIVSGGSGKGGAARLAARGALRVGAGLVTVAPTPGALQENAAQLDAIMLSPVGDAPTLKAVLADKRLNVLCLGPGLGVDRARDLVPVALAAGRATVLDADALTAFQDDPSTLFKMLTAACVITPHAGEFERLFPDIAKKLKAVSKTGPAYSKVDATREAAARAGCVVLFKGADTVIAGPEGRCSINSAAYDRAAPWLATAGSGDVLAGFITGLLARGFAPMQAAETAAWLHVECALTFGPGLIAEDLPDQLPSVFRTLGF